MAYFPTITYTNLKHKVADGLSSGDIKTKDEAITIVFNNGIGTTNKYKVSLNSPFNQITGTLSSDRELTKWVANVTPVEVDDYGPEVGNRATIITGISANTNTNFTITITSAVFTGSPTNTYRISLMGQSSLDYSWDCTQLYMVIDTNTSFTNTYTEVEYLESTTAGQYINTNYILDFNTKIISKNMPTADSSFMFWGAKDSAKREYSAYYNGASNGLRPYFNYDGSHSSQFYWGAMPINQIYEIEYDVKPTTQTFRLNGQTQTKTFDLSAAGIFDKPLLIFASSQWNTTYAYNGPSRCYYLKVYNGPGTLVRDLVPCIRNSDNKPGMYDRVNNVFYTNQGSGEFKYGPLKSVPQTYQQVEYIQSDGGQAINTELKLDMDKAKVEIVFQATTTSQNGMILANSGNTYWWLYHYSSLIQCYLDGTDGGQQNLSGPARDTNKHRVIYQNKTYYVDGTAYGTAAGTLGTTSSNLYLFKYSASDTTYTYKGKIYSCKIWNDGANLTKNYIPCYRKSDNTIGMLDLVNNVFYTNQGTGTFSKGADIINTNYVKYKPTDADGYDVHVKKLIDTSLRYTIVVNEDDVIQKTVKYNTHVTATSGNYGARVEYCIQIADGYFATIGNSTYQQTGGVYGMVYVTEETFNFDSDDATATLKVFYNQKGINGNTNILHMTPGNGIESIYFKTGMNNNGTTYTNDGEVPLTVSSVYGYVILDTYTYYPEGDWVLVSGTTNTYKLGYNTFNCRDLAGGRTFDFGTVSATQEKSSFIISFTKTSNCKWVEDSKKAYINDHITTSGTTVTCYKGSSSIVRWTNTLSYNGVSSGTLTISNGNIANVTAAATIAGSWSS